MSTLIKNGLAWLNNDLKPVELIIGDDGKIVSIGSTACDDKSRNRVIDAEGCWILPGGIDAHAHIQDGAETFYEGTCAAAAGGITTVVDMPPFHVCATPRGLEERVAQAEKACVTDFGQHGGIVIGTDDLPEMDRVAKVGAAGFKVFMPTTPPVTRQTLWESIKTAARTGLRMVIHAEEPALFAPEVNWDDPLGFAKARPPGAESAAAAFILEMAHAAGAPVHICHVSAARTAELIDLYRGWGTDVTAETTPHFLLFNWEDFIKYGASVKTTPPLREPGKSEILWQALSDGVIDIVVSDHFLGVLPEAGTMMPFQLKEPGIAGLEVSMPILYHFGVLGNQIDLGRFVQVTAERPADIFGFNNRKGRIARGMDADLVIFNPKKEWEVLPEDAFSRISTLPYKGWHLRGKVESTIVRGVEVWNGKDILVDQGFGRFVPRKAN